MTDVVIADTRLCSGLREGSNIWAFTLNSVLTLYLKRIVGNVSLS